MKKTSYDFATKSLYHKEFATFLGGIYPKKWRNNLRVACFPGHEALEVLRVYDLLGIPRENIVGIEKDKEIAKEIRLRHLGIQLFEGSDYEFFEQTNEKFDIINLDYQGTYTDLMDYSLRLISGRQILHGRGVVGTNVLGKREADSGLLYKVRFVNEEVIRNFSEAFLANISGKNNHQLISYGRLARMKIQECENKGMTLSDMRGDGLTHQILQRLGDGKSSLFISPLYLSLLDILAKENTNLASVKEEILSLNGLKIKRNGLNICHYPTVLSYDHLGHYFLMGIARQENSDAVSGLIANYIRTMSSSPYFPNASKGVLI